MQTIKIPFNGITRNIDDGICNDGECMELINARVKNGAIEPISKPILVKNTIYEYGSIFHHVIAKRYIGIALNGRLYEIREDFSSESPLTPDVSATKVEFIGNTMIALTNSGMRYFLFKGDTYLYLGKIPELPDIGIRTECKIIRDDGTTDLRVPFSMVDSQNPGELTDPYYLSAFIKMVSKANKEGYFVNSSVLRYAFRLYDGSYIKHSPLIFFPGVPSGAEALEIITVNGYTQTINFNSANKAFQIASSGRMNIGDRTIDFTFLPVILGIKPMFSYEAPPNLSGWKDVIIGIDVFASPNIVCDIPECNLNLGDVHWKLKSDKFLQNNPTYEIPDFKKEIIASSKFYKIASFDLKGNLDYNKENVSKDTIVMKEELSDDSGTNNELSSDSSYSYNNRLHLYDTKELLMSWYNPSMIYSPGEGRYYGFEFIDIYTYITTPDGDKILHRSGKIETQGITTAYIRGILMYPSSNAYKMILKIGNYYKEFMLTKHPYLNLAHYINWTGDYIQPITNYGSWPTWNLSITPSSDTSERRNNILKVSSLNNPFFFPAAQTYQFQAPIIGAQSNVIAMSQGQFGQFPLYVFTQDGIYSMQVGQGGVAYSTQTPITRDVCNNPNSICGLDTMVAFATEKGLMVINGAETRLISESIYGFLPSCVISSPVIPKILDIASLKGCLSSATFPNYLEGSTVGFNYGTHEIIIANKAFDYSYVYSLKTDMWHKISQNIQNFFNSYPYTWVLNGKQILDLNNNHRSVSTMALLSRPIKLGTTAHKRILQTALRGIVKRALSDLYLRGEPVMFRDEDLTIFSDVGFYVLGSNDGEHFALLDGKESIVDIRDVVTKMNKTQACKYFMIALVGGVRSDVSLNYIEMIVNESFDNRLR